MKRAFFKKACPTITWQIFFNKIYFLKNFKPPTGEWITYKMSFKETGYHKYTFAYTVSDVPSKFVGRSFEKTYTFYKYSDIPRLQEVKFYYGTPPTGRDEGMTDMTEKQGKVRNFKLKRVLSR